MWVFEYLGYAVFWLAMGSYLVTGPGFRGFSRTGSEARQIIDIITAGQCWE
jgi:hypothetical protein